jgi:hypothetical protein
MSDATVGQTKQFGKGQRTVPHPAQKAQKWYPVDDESQPKKVSIHPDKWLGFRGEYGYAFIRLDACGNWRPVCCFESSLHECVTFNST